MTSLSPGDRVRLKTAGKMATVRSVEGDFATFYVDEHEYSVEGPCHWAPLDALEPVEDER